jgi:hypothetical protein
MTALNAPAVAQAKAGERTDVELSRALVVAGVLLTLVFGVVAWRMALLRYFPGPGVTIDFKDILHADWRWVSVQYTVVVLIAFAAYGAALAVVRPGRRVPRVLLFGFPVLFCLALLWMYPAMAMDLVYYHASARSYWMFGDNPLLVAPDTHPYPVAFSWSDRPSVYGPVWTYLTALPTLLAGDHVRAGLLAFKGLAALGYLGCVWLVYRIVSRSRPDRADLAVIVFAWNPFVVFRAVGHGHNDIVMMFFVLLALERAQRCDWLAMFPALAASVMVKYVSALLGPLLLVYAWSQTTGTPWQRVRALAPGLAVASGLTVVAYAPFWQGPRIFDEVRAQAETMTITSTLLLLRTRLATAMPPDEALTWARNITRLVFVALYLPLLWQCRRDFTSLLTCSFNVFFLYLVVASGWFRPWYLLWPIAIAALMPGTWFMPLALVLSFAGSFPDLIEQYRLNWEWLRDYWRATAAPVMVWVWPALLVWYFGLLRYRSWHFDAPGRLASARDGP